MDKVERLISIIMILLKKDIVSTTEFAHLFNVSKRTIFRDMETLSLSNIPIYAINGINGGFGIMEEYKFDKRLLSNSDLENICTALGGLEKILLSEEVELTLKKIEALISPLALKRSIQLSFYDWEGRTEILPILKTCQQSIGQNKLITFDYMDKNGAKSNRTIEPYQLHFSETSWYLKGFCLERQGYRTFKLSRIDNLKAGEQIFVPRDFLLEQEASFTPQLVAIKALISPVIKDVFIERFGRKSIEYHSPDLLRVTFHLPQSSSGFQFLASFGTHLEIIEPPAYVEEFQSFLYQMLEKYTREAPIGQGQVKGS